MAEEVKTGGMKRFVYPKNYKVEEDPELNRSIDEAYERYEERKRKERRNWLIILVIVIIAVIAGLLILS
ncbi:hypothetical protein COV15_01510 [Candidatus Woesearchaeota archaeon CG10_big_fil_rev_8_21_14_0_10_34_12]|nr:MAG: hypothetical protein COV15_01510 [Candidatus Woesearchaeota archaeon CG10_big_fil_rev_8_21_14_0_10_34_12]